MKIADLELTPEQTEHLQAELETRARIVAEQVTGLNQQAAQDSRRVAESQRKHWDDRLRPSSIVKVLFKLSSEGWECIEDADTEDRCKGVGMTRNEAALDFDYNWAKPWIATDPDTGEFLVCVFLPTNRLMSVPPRFKMPESQFQCLTIADQPVPAETQPCGCTVKHLKEPDKERGTNLMWRRMAKCGKDECVWGFCPSKIEWKILNDQVRQGLENEGYTHVK